MKTDKKLSSSQQWDTNKPHKQATQAQFNSIIKSNLPANSLGNKYRLSAILNILEKQSPDSESRALLKEYLILKPESALITETVYAEVKFPEGYQKISEVKYGAYRLNHVMNYLKNRNIGMDLIKKYDIGYTTKGDFHTSIIIPSYDIYGEINYFIARSFDLKVKSKYLNPEAEKQEIIFNE